MTKLKSLNMPTNRRWIYCLPKYCLLIHSYGLSIATSLQIPNQQPPSTQNNLHPTGRRWKRRRKQQKFLPSPLRDVTIFEEEALMDQLGYLPPNICSVSAQSGDCTNTNTEKDGKIDTSKYGVGRPVAIQSYPLLVQQLQTDGPDKNAHGNGHYDSCNVTPFPTMYWLSDTHISRAISELERLGHVYEFQTRLEDNVLLAKEWLICHHDYSNERWMLLSDQDREWLQRYDSADDEKQRRTVESMRDMIRYSGVAGTDYKGQKQTDATWNDNEPFVPYVKCLHSHYAHYRSQLSPDAANNIDCKPNIVGLWTHKLLQEKFPDLVL